MKKLNYSFLMTSLKLHALGADDIVATRPVIDGFKYIGRALQELINSMDSADIPLMIASLDMVSTALSQSLPPSGKALLAEIKKNSTVISVVVPKGGKEEDK